MTRKPFIENPHYRDVNRDIENHTNAQPAILSTQEPGVALFVGRFKTCLTQDGAYKLAENIINALQDGKTNE